MNKKTATHNPSDVYNTYVKHLLKQHPEYWATMKNGAKTYTVWRKGRSGVVVEVISQQRFMKIVNLYYLLARRKVIAGGRFNLGHRLGAIQARTISRTFSNKSIDFNETKKQPLITDPVTGKQKRAKIIYHTSDEYSRIAWESMKCIPNEKMYVFKPCSGNGIGKGFTGEFSVALKTDSLLARKYKQFTDELPIN